MTLFNKRGGQPKWKPISVELRQMNAGGALNPQLAAKGLYRSNNAVMNKVKEMVFKASGEPPTAVQVRPRCACWDAVRFLGVQAS